MPRLRRSNPCAPGLTRKRVGRAFRYEDPTGKPVDDEATRSRIEALRIPPAWTDVWICSWPNGHIQAIGTDARGRRQYLYHDDWRTRRDREKFARVVDFARALPPARERVHELLAEPELSRDRVLAAAVRLLDLGFFRIGSEEYAEQNETFGLATIRRDHVTVSRGVITFDYTAKSGKHRIQSIGDPDVLAVVQQLKRRRGGGDELLAYKRPDGTWSDVKSTDVNAAIRELLAGEFTAKDFRTWNATVLASVALAVSEHAITSPTARKRATTRAIKEVADYLGNTPAVARASYIDPQVIDLFADGVTIAPALEHLGADVDFGQLATQGAIESAVLQLLTGETSIEHVRSARRAAS
ncbi:MAG: topoisomerase [Frankiales bacterium]|nr:topoisomerase [Frankiales bacterium]